jgi:peptidoglycan L-alanyl-D-glutamate endopeptidase CwlK
MMRKDASYLIITSLAAFFLYKIISMNKKTNKDSVPKTWDTLTDIRISKLHPNIRITVAEAINDFASKGIYYRITSSLRSMAEQADLYAKGRTASGNIVTNAKPGYSFHNYGLAFDFVRIKNNAADWTVGSFKPMIDYMITKGWQSGRYWSVPDWPHLQFNPFNSSAISYSALPKQEEGYPDLQTS